MNSGPPSDSTSGSMSWGAYPWIPDQGDGTYSNPVLLADYSDPDVIRHGDDYYLVASSFNCTPGLPILHSVDLVNWTLVNHALKNVPGERYQVVQPGCGVWAPSMRFHAGKFWIFFATPDEGIYQVTAADPRGTWSEPHLVQAGKGLIDPCPLWDDDKRAYLIHAYAYSRSGVRHRLDVSPMAPDGRSLVGEARTVFHQPERHPIIEGPKFYKREGWYYIFAPAGGVATGWQTVLRSRNIFGPYEDRIVLEQKRTLINGPHQGALVDTSAGDFWFLHFQDLGLYGRITHLQPVHWKDAWPVIGCHHDNNGNGEPVLVHPKPQVRREATMAQPQTNDEFDTITLGLQWQWQANHRDNWFSLMARPGWLRLFARPEINGRLAETPNLLLQKFPARAFVAETVVELTSSTDGGEAGLVVSGDAVVALAMRVIHGKCQLLFRDGEQEHALEELPQPRARLQVTIAVGGVCSFTLHRDDGRKIAIDKIFAIGPGKWIGAKLGVYCTYKPATSGNAFADFNCFRFSPPQPVTSYE